MTLYTAWFKANRKKGNVKKIGTASFMDGRCYKERTLWEVTNADGSTEEVVMLNGNAYNFRRYPENLQRNDGLIRGRA